MQTKPFWRSRAFWGGVISIVTGCGILIQGGNTAEALAAILGGVAAILGRVRAVQPLGLRRQGDRDDPPR